MACVVVWGCPRVQREACYDKFLCVMVGGLGGKPADPRDCPSHQGPGFRGFDRGRGCCGRGAHPLNSSNQRRLPGTQPPGIAGAQRSVVHVAALLPCMIFRERQRQNTRPRRARARLVPHCSSRILQSLILGEANNCNAILPFSSNLQQPSPARLAQAMLWGTEAVEERCLAEFGIEAGIR